MSAHLLGVGDLGRDGILEVLRLAESFAEVNERPIPKVPSLRGRTVATVFFENSTRTRLSFETAAKRLSADTMSFAAQGSSLSKGESLRDTVETIDAMGADALVVRHRCAGVPAQVARWVSGSVLNAGDGQHEHPTQALLDCYSMREALARTRGSSASGDLSGVRVAIVGDVRHSRVARSNVVALGLLGAEVVLVGPATLMPPEVGSWGVEHGADLDAVLERVDVVYLLRLQSERMLEALLPSTREYERRFGLSVARAGRLKPDALVMHPGPMNRGVEIADEVASGPQSIVTAQVRNGIAVRMAVLFLLLASPGAVPATEAVPRG